MEYKAIRKHLSQFNTTYSFYRHSLAVYDVIVIIDSFYIVINKKPTVIHASGTSIVRGI